MKRFLIEIFSRETPKKKFRVTTSSQEEVDFWVDDACWEGESWVVIDRSGWRRRKFHHKKKRWKMGLRNPYIKKRLKLNIGNVEKAQEMKNFPTRFTFVRVEHNRW